MPGPFTHIYAARRAADLLAQLGQFSTPADGPLAGGQPLADPAKAAYYASVMHKYPKLASVGAIGPDMFFFLADLRDPATDGDEFMLLLRMVYLGDAWKAGDWTPLISLLSDPAYKKAHPWASILALLLQIDAAWTNFVTHYTEQVAPVVDGFGNLVNALTGDILRSIGDYFNECFNEIGFFVADLGLDQLDLLGVFKLVMLYGEDETTFFWSDMLHYRRTSQMAQTLLRMAEDMIRTDLDRGEQFLAYALGFACHLGTDIVGHSFVNEQAGGPYRTHWDRHHLVENHLDAWVYAQTAGSQLPQDSFCAWSPGYGSLSQSALYFAVAFTDDNPQGDLRRVLPDDTPPHGYDSAAQLARKQALDTDGELPDWLAQAIVKALIATYGDGPHPQILRGGAFQPTMDAALEAAQLPADPPLGFAVPPGFPLPWQVQTAYKLMLSFFKRAYMDDFDLPLPPPPGQPAPAQWPDFGNVSGIDPSTFGSFFTSALQDVGNAIGDFLNSIASLIEQFTDPLSLSLRQELYTKLTQPAWQSAHQLRQRLVETGYLIPQNFEVDQAGRLKHPNEIDFSLITLGSSAGQPALPDPGYPWQSVPNEFQRPWVYPATNLDNTANNSETGPTRAGSFAAGALPDQLLGHYHPASNALRLSYETAHSPAGTDAITASATYASASAGGVSPLGDCVQFAAYLIGRLAAPGPPPADFNLDADRGYGYLCWDWHRDPTQTWTGTRNQAFHPPAGWTSAPSPAQPKPSYPLQLHYLPVSIGDVSYLVPLLLGKPRREAADLSYLAPLLLSG